MKTWHGWCGKYNTRKADLRNRIIYGVSNIEDFMQLARILRRIMSNDISRWHYVNREVGKS